MSAMGKNHRSQVTHTQGKLSPVRNTTSRATGAGVVVRSTPGPIIGPEEGNRAHCGALGARTVNLCPDTHGQRGDSRDCGSETHLEDH